MWEAYTMPNYRRNKLESSTFFFTVNLLERKKSLLVDHIDVLRNTIRVTLKKKPFFIEVHVS